MKKYLIVFFSLLTIASVGFSQKDSVTLKIEDKMKRLERDQLHDSLFNPGIKLNPVTIFSLRSFKKKSDQKRYDKLVRHIKKVYPYARKAAVVLHEEEAKMASMDKGDRKAHMKKVEKRIEHEFGGELKNLTFTQGRILLKLIDRETGYTSYELVDELRGTFRAWFYDGIAGLFGYDLKGEFDIEQHLEDKYINEVVLMIEAGQL